MPVFTSIGVALGLAGGAATIAGIGVAAGVGALAFQAGQSSSVGESSVVDSRVSAATDTGQITEAEAKTAARKRAFRSGVLFTSPTGLDSDPVTSSAKLR